MGLVFLLGASLGALAPLFRRIGRAGSATLASGAGILVCLGVAGLLWQDPREGLAAAAANRRQCLFVLAWEVPVLALALGSWRQRERLFWLAWAIHAAFLSWVLAVYVWLQYFWHW